MHGINETKGAVGVGNLSNFAHRRNGAKCIRGRANGYQPRFLVDCPLEFTHRPFAGHGIERHGPDGYAPLYGYRPPRGDVRLVIEVSHDNLVTRAPGATQSARDMERNGRHVVAKSDFSGRGVEKVSHGCARISDAGIRLDARRVVPMSVGVVMIKVIGHCLGHWARDLSTAGSIEVANWLAILPTRQCREQSANGFYRCQFHLGCWWIGNSSVHSLVIVSSRLRIVLLTIAQAATLDRKS